MTEQASQVQGDDGTPRGPRVVVGVDGSPGARAALLFALHDAVRRGLPVEALTAYHPPDNWMDFYGTVPAASEQARTAAVEQVRAFVADVLPDGPQPPPAVTVRAELGSAADALIRASHQAELLVIGSRGHGGFTSMLLGSVSMQCVLHAACPVTVVHSPEAHRERLHLRRRRHAEARLGGLPAA